MPKSPRSPLLVTTLVLSWTFMVAVLILALVQYNYPPANEMFTLSNAKIKASAVYNVATDGLKLKATDLADKYAVSIWGYRAEATNNGVSGSINSPGLISSIHQLYFKESPRLNNGKIKLAGPQNVTLPFTVEMGADLATAADRKIRTLEITIGTQLVGLLSLSILTICVLSKKFSEPLASIAGAGVYLTLATFVSTCLGFNLVVASIITLSTETFKKYGITATLGMSCFVISIVTSVIAFLSFVLNYVFMNEFISWVCGWNEHPHENYRRFAERNKV